MGDYEGRNAFSKNVFYEKRFLKMLQWTQNMYYLPSKV